MFRELSKSFHRDNAYDTALAALFGLCSLLFVSYALDGFLKLSIGYLPYVLIGMLLPLSAMIFWRGIEWTRRSRVVILVSLAFSLLSLAVLVR